ncbi:hypothetical protein IC582_005657 [Cucumis melo]
MATEREEVQYEGGRGGKFQKRPIRRSHTTPYDRPPTALRNSAAKGWLSKLVDPAQKLITSSAHRLFSTVFRKRLPPPPPSFSLSREANEEMEHRNQEEVAADPSGTQEGTNVGFVPSINSNNTQGLSDLEKILKEKTFSRFEIDRLTELLKSRVADVPSGVESRKFEQVPSTPVTSHGLQEGSPKFLTQSQDGVSPHMAPTHVVNANVLDEDVASPAEIAKAYMGSRPPKATPLSMAGNPSKSSTLSLVPRSPGNFDVVENGFVTPRSRGRSALYSMARVPYSRVRATPSIKNSIATTDAYRATTSSSSQSAWEQGGLLGSKQGALKRRNSVLDDDMGSVGPIRRTRQKSNHLFPTGLSLPSSSTSIPASGIRSETARHLQSTKVHPFSSNGGKPLYSSETQRNFSKTSAESKNAMTPSSSFPRIPLRSSEMASKILEQLDILTPPKEKSSELKLLSVRNNLPMKLSPSMLHGPALRSLENVDSAKYLENVEGIQSNDARDPTSQKNDKFEESSPSKSNVPNDKSISTSDGVGSSVPTKDIGSGSGMQVSFVGPSVQTKCAFQMSAHEDFVDMDEEGFSNGPVADKSFEMREKVDDSLVSVSKPKNTEAITVVKSKPSIEAKPSVVSVMNKINDQGKSDVPTTTEKSPIFSFPTTSSPSSTANVKGPESSLRPEKVASPELPKAATAPIFGFGEKSPSQKETVSQPPTFTFGSKATTTNEQNAIPVVTSEANTEPTKQASTPTTFKFGDKASFSIPANAATENGNKSAGSLFKFTSPLVNEKEGANVGGSASVFKAENSSSSIPSFGVPKESMSDKAGDKSSSPGLIFGTSGNLFSSSVSTSTSTPTSSLFSFSSPSTNSNLNNGSLVSITPSTLPTPATTFSNNVTSQNSSIKPSSIAATSNSEPVTSTSPPMSSPMPSFSAAPIFKFGSSSVPSTSASALSAPSGVGSVEAKTKPETTFGNLSGLPPSDTAAVKVASTGSSVFQFGAASTTSDANKGPANSTFAQNNIPAFGAPVSFSSSGLASSTQSTPALQFSSSKSFGLTGNTGLASGSSLFGSSAPASNPFTSGATFGLASSSSSANNSVSSSAGTSSSFFNWQPSSTPSFSTGFSSTPSGGFSFGLSSSSSASNSAPMVFGSSSTGASPASMFSFTSAASATTSQPAFGNSNNAFTFGSTPPANNNEQASMEDSMAEDTVQTASPMPSFGQQPLTPPPSSGFMFGSTAPSPLGANPFQFGGSQQNVPQNPSPFQASGSLDFNASAGGSFSLGAGGGDKSNRKYVKVKSKSRKK